MIIERISDETKIDPGRIRGVIFSADFRYKVYHIPKKAGGIREIAQPSRIIKFMQRWSVRNVFSCLPIDESAYAYRQGVSVRDHVLPHVGKKFILRVDFKNFFPSIDVAPKFHPART